MTAPTTTIDPHAHVRPGQDWDLHQEPGACTAEHGPSGLACTRGNPHPGHHIATGGRNVMGVWIGTGDTYMLRDNLHVSPDDSVTEEVYAATLAEAGYTAAPEIDHEADLIDSDGDVWVFVGFRDHDGQSMYALTGHGRDVTDTDLDVTREAITDPADYWAHESGASLREDAATERVRAALTATGAPVAETPAAPTLVPDLMDRTGDLWVYLGEHRGEPYYTCAGRAERLSPEEIETARARRPEHGASRRTVAEDWAPLTERPRVSEAAPEPEPQTANAPVEEPDLECPCSVWIYTGTAPDGVRHFRYKRKSMHDITDEFRVEQRRELAQRPGFALRGDPEHWVRGGHLARTGPRRCAGPITELPAVVPTPVPAEPVTALEPDLETRNAFWVYTGTDNTDTRRYRCVTKNAADGTPTRDLEEERRRFSGGEYDFPTGSDVESYIRRQGATERPRTLRREQVDGPETPVAAPETPVAAPAAPVEGEAFSRDADGLPADPGEGADPQVRIAALTARAAEVKARDEAFRARTREEVLRWRRENNWCDGGSNGALRDLGLDQLYYNREVSITVRLTVAKTASDQQASTYARNIVQRAIRDMEADKIDTGSVRVEVGRVQLDSIAE